MKQTVVRISPHQAGKIFGVMYFIFGLAAAPFFLLTASLAPGQRGLGVGFALVLPIFYALAGYVGMAFFSWLYNLVAKWTGGIAIEVAEDAP